MFQQTIKNKIEIHGPGLHTGKLIKVTFKGSEANSGVKFRRIDLDKKLQIFITIIVLNFVLKYL